MEKGRENQGQLLQGGMGCGRSEMASGTSLGIQGLRIHLAVQGMWAQPLVGN